MSEWEKDVGAIVLFVEDLERSKAFYREVFALPAQGEDANSAMFRFQNTMIVLLQTSAAHELIGPAPSQAASWVALPAQHLRRRPGCGVRGAGQEGSGADQRPDRSPMGRAHGHVRRPRRPVEIAQDLPRAESS